MSSLFVFVVTCIALSHAQYGFPTDSPTKAPTSCQCTTYSGSYLNDDGTGCEYCPGWVSSCTPQLFGGNDCKCYSESQCDDITHAAAAAVGILGMGICACICVCGVLPFCVVAGLCALCIWCLNGSGRRKQNVYIQAPSGPPMDTMQTMQPQTQTYQPQQPQVYIQATVPQ